MSIVGLLFVFKHALLFAAVLLAVSAAGTLAVGSHENLALRSALGFALWGHALFLLALVGQLGGPAIVVLGLIAIAGGIVRGLRIPRIESRTIAMTGGVVLAAAFVMALRPPLAFDETTYHLPFVRALASGGQLRFLIDLRFPVFPQMHELLCVPLFLAAGDAATHLVSLAEMLITTALLLDWGRRYAAPAGALAAGVFIGSPIVIHLATIGYVESALTLFVTAGFYCLDRARVEGRVMLAWSGLFFGTACGVKYLGGFFAVAAGIIVVWHWRRSMRLAAIFAGCVAAAALPTTAWIAANSGNPLFPFLPSLFGASAWAITMPEPALAVRVTRTLRLVWNVTFARSSVNEQPPFTPFLVVIVVTLIAAAIRDVRARYVAAIVVAYAIVFSSLPQDSRYLVPLLPLLSIVAAVALGKRASALAIAGVGIAILYAGYALAVRGLPPLTADARESFLREHIPEYAALERAQSETVYVYGAEQLKYYAGGKLLGDLIGPYSYDRMMTGAGTTSAIAARLRRIDARCYLVAKRVCFPPRPDGQMELIYEDSAAQLWRVQRNQSSP